MHRRKGNAWAIIAADIKGRTDNTIKNHWNSSMRKKLSDFKKEFDSQCRKYFAENKLEFHGANIDSKTPTAYA